MITLVTCLCCDKRNFSEGKLDLQFERIKIYDSKEGMAPGEGCGWSLGIHNKEAGRDEYWCSACIFLLIQSRIQLIEWYHLY